MNLSTPIDPIYVVDTNALIWYLTNNKKLSQLAAHIFAAAERGECQICVSAMVISELYYADKKWKLFDDFAQTYADLKAKAYIQLIPFLADEVLDFDQNAAVPEMHDRIITGVARRLSVPLITSDPLIIAANLVKIVW